MGKALNRPTALRSALLLDAVASGAMGLLLLLAAGALQPLLGLPIGLLRGAGIVLVPFAGLLVAVAASERASRGVVLTVVAANVLWAVCSVLLFLSGWVAPTALGKSCILVQAVAVAVFAYLEHNGLRRDRAALAFESAH